MPSDRRRRRRWFPVPNPAAQLAVILAPSASHRPRRVRGETRLREPLDSFLQESALKDISASSMAYSLTAAMFLISYLFPFSVTVSPNAAGGDAKVIVPSNERINITSGTTIRIPCIFDGKESAIMRGKWNKDFQLILQLRNGMIVFNRDYQALTKNGRFDLIIRDIQARDKGVYQCVGTTNDGEMRFSKTVNLHILEAATPEAETGSSGKTRIVLPKNNQLNTELGTKLVIRCPVTFNSPHVKSAMWQKDLVQVGELKNGRAVFDRPYRGVSGTSGRFNLVITSVKPRDKGIYQCVGFDAKGKLLVGETLTITINEPGGYFPKIPPPRRKEQNIFVFVPDNSLKDVPVGKTVIIRCPLVQNDSEVQNATWEKNWVMVGTLSSGKAVFYPPRPAVNTSVPIGIFDIVIANVRVRDEGTYQCVNFFSTGNRYSKTLNLRVPIASERPRIFQVLSGLSYPVDLVRKAMIPAGKELKLQCEAKRGHPGANIVWRVGGALLVSNHTGPFRIRNITGSLVHNSIVEGKKKPPLFRSTESILVVKLPLKFNNSLILCMAINPGSSRKRALTRVVMVERAGGDSNSQAPPFATSFVLSLFVPVLCRLLLL